MGNFENQNVSYRINKVFFKIEFYAEQLLPYYYYIKK